ncbi:cadherin-like protein 26 [Amblyraja radiata]|uniref:cadherin-like protein 26 n=1 Tax=Amblyraja radiata TaxID=386614 RepID=UPI001403AF8E|nr:cadherin-like protein 26 [Amblyraja radiata]
MVLGFYALVLFFITEICSVEGQGSIILHREKRRWITATFRMIEDDPGPYPKEAIKLNNDKSQNHTLIFIISGEGVDRNPEKELFKVNKNTGQIYITRKVDREQTKSLTFKIDVHEEGTSNALDDHMMYKIEVIDINDNNPKFTRDVYEVHILESTFPGTEIYQIKAVDPDERENGTVVYSIVSQNPTKPSNMFKIHPNNGSILLQQCLNYETLKSYTLVIKARDKGHNMLSSSAEVRIKVIDSNNNLPVFTLESAEITINESDKDVVILRVGVTDRDTPNTPSWRAKYQVTEGNEHKNYKMETDPATNNGVLMLIKHLDYEAGPVRNIKISVENEEPLFICPGMKDTINTKPQHLTVLITVNDLNDPPVFNPPVLIVHEIEGQKPGKVLGKFNASDTDVFYKHSIKYYRAFEPAEWVTVDVDTGVVTTVQELDRESPYVNKSVYTFTVHAVEEGKIPETSTGTMSLVLADINDNLPFLTTTHQEMCDENGIPFVTVAANDADVEPFGGPFIFELLDNEEHIKKNWKLGKATDYNVQLERIRKIPIGDYVIPFKIRDRQGISQETSMNLHVCHCVDGITCPLRKSATAALGGAAIGLLFAGLLFLILGLCLLLFCSFTKKFTKSFSEPVWTLIKYNDEGIIVDSKKPPSIHSSTEVFNDGGLGIGSNFPIRSAMQGNNYEEEQMFPYEADGRRMTNTLPRHSMHGWTNRRNLGSSSHGASTLNPRNYSCNYGAQDMHTRQYLGSSSHAASAFNPRNYSFNYGAQDMPTSQYSHAQSGTGN